MPHTKKPGLVGITTQNMDPMASGREPNESDGTMAEEAKMREVNNRTKKFVMSEMKMKGRVKNARGHTGGSPR